MNRSTLRLAVAGAACLLATGLYFRQPAPPERSVLALNRQAQANIITQELRRLQQGLVTRIDAAELPLAPWTEVCVMPRIWDIAGRTDSRARAAAQAIPWDQDAKALQSSQFLVSALVFFSGEQALTAILIDSEGRPLNVNGMSEREVPADYCVPAHAARFVNKNNRIHLENFQFP